MTAVNVHLYVWRPSAVWVPPEGRIPEERLRLGAWVCVACQGLLSWHAYWCASCPGFPESPATRAARTIIDARARTVEYHHHNAHRHPCPRTWPGHRCARPANHPGPHMCACAARYTEEATP